MFAVLGLVAAGTASAENCSGTITAEEAMKAEAARYAAQTANDFAAMEKLFGNDLSDVKTRTYGCLAIITGTAVYEVTSGGQDRTVPLRFTAIWVKRPSGLEFVSWQSTGIPPRQ
ncbi:MAG: hypothetical protein DME12_16800 [Candidatus Rokuibacteriota bacterium]|nr:MAG: hypothetical protein DME12_16800 [Candidatus Rokubacteria bacterium]